MNQRTATFSFVEHEAAIVRLMYDLYLQEKSLLVVAKMLNEKGYRSRRGAAWSPVSVHGILRNPFYVGVYRYNYRDESKTGNASNTDLKPESEWVMLEDHHDALIDRDKWERVAAIRRFNLYDKREVNYVKMAREIDPRILKDFVTEIVQNFCIKDGKVESICFKVGIELRFLYSNDEE